MLTLDFADFDYNFKDVYLTPSLPYVFQKKKKINNISSDLLLRMQDMTD